MPRIPAARDRVQWIEHVWSIILTRIEERYTLTISANLIVMDGASCGVVFVVTEEFRVRRQETGEGFDCPNGHSLVYTSRIAELEAKLKRERRKAPEWQNSYQGERRRHEATERQLINCAVGNHPHTYGSDDAGVCPCCSRHFAELEWHMSTKHPEYLQGGEA